MVLLCLVVLTCWVVTRVVHLTVLFSFASRPIRRVFWKLSINQSINPSNRSLDWLVDLLFIYLLIICLCSSEKLKPFWLSIQDVDVSVVAAMSNCLQSRDGDNREYRSAVSRALAIPTCKLVPFFGTFLRDLRAILANVSAIVVFPTNAEHSLEVRLHQKWSDSYLEPSDLR